MSEISKQALKVDNSQSFPNNNAGEITPSDLRAFNVNVIDSTVNQTEYTTDSGSWNSKIAQLNAFTASQQPSFTALNSFTASQLNINSGYNTFTQSANAELDSLSAWTGSWNAWTSSINEIRDDGVLQGYSTRFFFNGLVSASIVQNVNGPIANVTVESDGTKLNTSSFNAFTASIASQQTEIDGLSAKTGSYATTGSNIFTGNQFVNGFVSASNGFYSGPNTTALNIGDGSNVRFWSGSTGGGEYFNVQLVPGVGDVAFSRSGDANVKVMTLAGVAGNNTTFQNNPVVFNDSVSSLTVNAQSTAISGSGSYTLQASTISQTAVNATTIASASVRGTFDITGQSGGDGRVIMLGHSGSLVLGNSGVNTYYGALAHLSSSAANANTNLIFKTNTNTADTIISGSGNIFTNPSAPTAGFKRYMTTGNIAIAGSGASVPQISGSMAWSPTISNNLFLAPSTPLTWRGPASASASTVLNNVIAGGAINLGLSAANHFERAAIGVNVTGNLVAGAINAIASKTPLSSSIAIGSNIIGGTATLAMDSSSIGFNGNSVQGGLTVNNSYLPNTTTGIQHITSINGGLYIGTHTIYASGSNTAFTGNPGRTITNAVMLGTNNVISASLNADLAQVASTSLIGQGLIVVGSNSRVAGASAADWGSVFVGRWNSIDGTKDMTGETVFAVGTGTGASTRKTGFLIDSGSNTFVEGSLTITGSVYGNVSASTINSSTASIDLSTSNYFTLTMAGTTNINVINARAGVTATLVIRTSDSAVASFSNNVKQPSGSLYVASPSGNIDIISFTAVDSNTVYAFPAQSFV